jgi:hypothetical protein
MTDCPEIKSFLNDDQKKELKDTGKLDFRGTPEFDEWREASEKDGCLTPIGGASKGD